MPITASEILYDRAQADGRRRVLEQHTDSLSRVYNVSYLAAPGADANAALAARVVLLEAALKEAEIEANIARALDGETSGFSLEWSTANENYAALRQLYSTLTSWELIIIGHVLHHQSLSDALIRNLFGVSQAQVQGIRDRLEAKDTLYHAILAEVGE